MLGQQYELPVTALADRLRVSLPLLSRHLAVLRAAQLVTEHRDGRRRLYRLQPEPLRELYDWASVFAGFWSDRLRGLQAYLQRGSDVPPATTWPPGATTTGEVHES